MTGPTDLKPGELVDIVIRQAKVIETRADGGVLVIAYDQEHSERIELVTGNRVGVERVAPAEWPPEIGDVWRDSHGVLWFVSLGEVGGTMQREYTPSSTRAVSWGSYDQHRLLSERGPLTLVHREHRPDPDGADL